MIAPWFQIARAVIIAAVFSAAMTFAYVKGGERERTKHAAYVIEQQAKEIAARIRWAAEKSQLEAQISLARSLARSAVESVNAADEDANRRIDEAVRAARSEPMSTDEINRINAIVAQANK